MVAHFVRLKFRLLLNSLSGGVGRIIGLVLAVLYGLLITALVVAALIGLRFAADFETTRIVVVLAGSLLIVGWLTLPLFAFGIDETLDPLRFQTYAVPMSGLIGGLFTASFISVPAIVTTFLLFVSVITWSYSPAAVVVAFIAAVLAAATCVALSRAVTTTASAILAGRKMRDVASVATLLVVVFGGLGFNWAVRSQLSVGQGTLEAIADVAGWTPFGFTFAAPADAATGHAGLAAVRLLLAAATLAACLAIWAFGLRRSLEQGPTHRQQSVRVSSGLGWFSRLPGTPAGAVAARAVTYWRRDPRYFGSIIIIVLIPLLVIGYAYVLSGTGDAGPVAYFAVAPIVGYLIGWQTNADVSMDNTAFALHVAAGVDGRADRIGRILPWAAIGAPITVLYSTGAAWITGRWDLWPADLGLALCLMLAGLAVSCVVSIAIIYPTVAPGDNPFHTPSGATGITLLVQFVSGLVILGIVSPVLIGALVAMLAVSWLGWIVLPVGVVLGMIYLAIGLRQGSRIYDRQAPDALAKLQSAAAG